MIRNPDDKTVIEMEYLHFLSKSHHSFEPFLLYFSGPKGDLNEKRLLGLATFKTLRMSDILQKIIWKTLRLHCGDMRQRKKLKKRRKKLKI